MSSERALGFPPLAQVFVDSATCVECVCGGYMYPALQPCEALVAFVCMYMQRGCLVRQQPDSPGA